MGGYENFSKQCDMKSIDFAETKKNELLYFIFVHDSIVKQGYPSVIIMLEMTLKNHH